jgi:hypothetical protein
MRSRIHLIILTALSLLMVPVGSSGCTEGTCEGNCFEQYDDCLARAPPGASKADCGAAYDSCLQYCSSVSDDPAQGSLADEPAH